MTQSRKKTFRPDQRLDFAGFHSRPSRRASAICPLVIFPATIPEVELHGGVSLPGGLAQGPEVKTRLDEFVEWVADYRKDHEQQT